MRLHALALAAASLGMPGVAAAADFSIADADYASAPPALSGLVEAAVGWWRLTDPTEDAAELLLRGSVNSWLDGRFGGQVDAVVSDLIVDGEHNVDLDFALHLYARDPDRGLLGVLGQYRASLVEGDHVADQLFAGIEGQIYAGMVTLYGQAGYQSFEAHDGLGGDGDGYFLRLEGRFFPDPNTRIIGRLGFEHMNESSFFDLDTTFVTVRGERRLGGLPVTMFADYSYTHQDFEVFDFDVHRVMVGFQLDCNTGTLLERDRYGVTLNPVTTPGFSF